MVTLGALLDALVLEEVGPDRYRGRSVQAGHGGVFGGQLLAQALVAAMGGHDGKATKTLHGVFVSGARDNEPLDITVDPMHRGRGFASSTVTIAQQGRLCLRALVLLSGDEPDLIRHADGAAGLTPPSAAAGDPEAWEVQLADDVDIDDPSLVGPPDLDVWTRFAGAPDDLTTNQALLAFVSDFYLIGTAMRPHPGVGQALAHKALATSVISHTVTFHEPFSLRDWLMLRHHSSYAGRGRSHGRGDVFQHTGALVASFVQDNMIRPMSGVSR